MIMGRAERRRLERKNRLEDRNAKILMRPDDIKVMKEKITKDVCNNFGSYTTEAMMTCFALANHRLWGHGWKRTMRTLQYIDELMGPINDGTKTMAELKDELMEEMHFKVDAGFDMKEL